METAHAFVKVATLENKGKFSFRNNASNLTIFSIIITKRCFCQTVPFWESRVAIREGPQKNGKRTNLALYFYKAACRRNPSPVLDPLSCHATPGREGPGSLSAHACRLVSFLANGYCTCVRLAWQYSGSFEGIG